MFNLSEVYATISIGHNTAKILVCEVNRGKINVLRIKSVPTKGMLTDNVITKPKELSKQIGFAMKEINKFIGLKIERVIVLLPASSLKIKNTTQITNLPEKENLITKAHIHNVMEKLKESRHSEETEIVEIIPFSFKVDGNIHTKPPIGTTGKRIEANALVSTIDKKIFDSHKDVIIQSGVQILDFLIEPFATACEVTTKSNMRDGVFVVNVGTNKTSVSRLKNEVLISSVYIDAGTSDVDKLLAKAMKIPEVSANNYKTRFVNSFNKNDGDIIIHSSWNHEKSVYVDFEFKDINKVVEKVHVQILKAVDKVIKLQSKNEKPLVIITGEDASLIGYSEWVKENFDWELVLYKPTTIGVSDVNYASLLGASFYISHINNMVGIRNQSTDPYIGELENLNKHTEKVQTLWFEMFKWSSRLLPKR